MRSDLQFKLLAYLNDNQEEKGFTLIELLVVVIIIGVLAAVALPNLLKQVGKARETEIKNAAGTVNRSQQSYHFERQQFAPGLSFLGISVPTEYITNGNTADNLSITRANGVSDAKVQPANTNWSNDGTRAYSGLIIYANGTYAQSLCQSNDATAIMNPPANVGSTDCEAPLVNGTQIR